MSVPPSRPRPVIWLALDGVGHPADAPVGSPWERELPALRPLIDAGLALDATLGVPGLPQSATGQSCWLTGENAVSVMGEHFGPQPGPTLRRLLDAAALPGRLTRAGGRVALLNTYPPAYFEAHRQRPRHGCFPYSFLAAGLPLNPPGVPLLSPTLGLAFRAGWAAQDTLDDWQRHGEALGQVRGYELLVLDLWFSDVLGHEGRPEVPPDLQAAAGAYLTRLDALVAGLLGTGAPLVLSSDHGNFENLTLKTHTTARVPLATANLPAPMVSVQDVQGGGAWLRSLYGV